MTKKAHFFLEAMESLFGEVPAFLNGETDFQFLIAVMLSAQMTDKGVNKATNNFFKTVKTAQDAVNMGQEQIYEHVKSVNYAPTKAKHVFACAQRIVEVFDNTVPTNRKDLVSLAGVGEKTAGVFLLERDYDFAFPVDTHISRVMCAFGFSKNTNPNKIEEDLRKKFPKEHWKPLHKQIILYGRNYLPARDIPRTQKQTWENLEKNLENPIPKNQIKIFI